LTFLDSITVKKLLSRSFSLKNKKIEEQIESELKSERKEDEKEKEEKKFDDLPPIPQNMVL
jgi:hypothetical protein